MADVRSTVISDDLYRAALVRMNYTWELDQKTEMNVRHAIEEAMAHLRKYAGAPDLSFEDGDLRTLLLDCAWYIINKMRAEFDRVYSSDLINLRLMEGFGCGKRDETDPV